MARGPLLSVRVTPEVMKRLDRLIPKLARNPSISTLGKVTRSTVVKFALIEGLDALEKRGFVGHLNDSTRDK